MASYYKTKKSGNRALYKRHGLASAQLLTGFQEQKCSFLLYQLLTVCLIHRYSTILYDNPRETQVYLQPGAEFSIIQGITGAKNGPYGAPLKRKYPGLILAEFSCSGNFPALFSGSGHQGVYIVFTRMHSGETGAVQGLFSGNSLMSFFMGVVNTHLLKLAVIFLLSPDAVKTGPRIRKMIGELSFHHGEEKIRTTICQIWFRYPTNKFFPYRITKVLAG
jgi:hypothetical protein